MKTFKQIRTEGWFKKKEKEDPDYEELKKLGAKAAGRGGWSKKEQDRYNDLWMKMHKNGKKTQKNHKNTIKKHTTKAQKHYKTPKKP